MLCAPVGLGAYFAYQVGRVLVQKLFGAYASALALCLWLLHFLLYSNVSVCMHFFADGIDGVKTYWKNNIIPSANSFRNLQ